MAKKRLKVLITDDRPEVIDALKNMLPQQDLTMVADASEALQRAGEEEFDLIITAVAVPAVSGLEGITGSQPLEGQVTRDKAAILRELRQMLQEAETAVQSKEAAHALILQESQARQEKILELLNNQVRQSHTERAELNAEVERLLGELERAMQSKIGLEQEVAVVRQEMKLLTDKLHDTGARLQALEQEKAAAAVELTRLQEETARTMTDLRQQLEQALTDLATARREQSEAAQEISRQAEEIGRLREEGKSIKELQEKVKALTAELQEAVAAADNVLTEKVKVEEKLRKLQQNWEKYVAGQ